MKKKIPKTELTVKKFLAMPDAEKNQVYAEIDALTSAEIRAQSRPMDAGEKAQWKHIQKKVRRGRGRPRLGRDPVQRVSVSIERSLLNQIDQFAKSHGLNRSEMFVRSAANFIGKSAESGRL